ncbi:MAG TPA: hypothetical protein VN822_04770, partial [Candidatus Acidoferrales bacterium]|nr:hypothetical protein [Candidatus Acidoferrales bacterium]
MIGTKVATVTVIWNAVAVVAAALLPVAVLGLPVVCPMLLPDSLLFVCLPMLLFQRTPRGLLLVLLSLMLLSLLLLLGLVLLSLMLLSLLLLLGLVLLSLMLLSLLLL